MISEIKLHEIPAALAGMLDLIQVDEETGEIEPATLESVQIASEEKSSQLRCISAASTP